MYTTLSSPASPELRFGERGGVVLEAFDANRGRCHFFMSKVISWEDGEGETGKRSRLPYDVADRVASHRCPCRDTEGHFGPVWDIGSEIIDRNTLTQSPQLRQDDGFGDQK